MAKPDKPVAPEFEPVGDPLEPTMVPIANVDIEIITRNPAFLQFQMNQTSGPAGIVQIGPNGLYIAVENDVIIRFNLAGTLHWTWADIPITFKNNIHSRKYHRGNSSGGGKVFELHCSALGGSKVNIHECSFNVMLTQQNGTPLLVKIDPEIKNPPPPVGVGLTPGQPALL